MQQLVETYEILGNATERQKYDMYRASEVTLIYLLLHVFGLLMQEQKLRKEEERMLAEQRERERIQAEELERQRAEVFILSAETINEAGVQPIVLRD